MTIDGRYSIGWKDDTPNTSKFAKPCDWEEVRETTAVDIKNGYYREALFNGVFEISDIDKMYANSPKCKRVIVKTHWFGCRPSTKWPAILIENAEYEILSNYTGKVVRNIGK